MDDIIFSDHIIFVLYSGGGEAPGGVEVPVLNRAMSTTDFEVMGDQKEAEYFFASDASAVIEHTNKVIYLEDDDVAAVRDGCKWLGM